MSVSHYWDKIPGRKQFIKGKGLNLVYNFEGNFNGDGESMAGADSQSPIFTTAGRK